MAESRFKSFLNGFARPFKALVEDDEDEKELQEEVEKINKAQKNLKKERDYTSNIIEDFIPKVNVKNVKVKQTGTRRKKDLELEK